MNGLALCAGYGGLELGIERVFPEARTVCYVEGEAFAVQHIVKKMEEGSLDEAPIWSNVKTFEGKPWRGKVDWLSGGFPCQPYSTAGKQMGEADARDLWPDFVRIIGEVRPGFLFLENVPNVVKLRLDQIILDLDKLGYDVAWGNLSAAEVGAVHKRNRWFLFGVADTDTHNSIECSSCRAVFQEGRHNVGGICENVSNSNCKRRDKDKRDIRGGKLDFERCSEGTIDHWGEKFNEWWKVEPSMGRLVDGASDWVDKLRLLGNGVVPQQAAQAFQILGERLACGIVEKRTPKD